MSSALKNRTTIEKKFLILEAVITKLQIEVSKEFVVDKSVVSRIKKNEKVIQQEALKNGNLVQKRQKGKSERR